jgi:sugar (pentulose or hexulose) kinase
MSTLSRAADYAVLIDVGGSFLKGAVVTAETAQLSSVIRKSGPRLELTREGSATLDPTQLTRDVRLLCRELVNSVGRKPSAIFLTGQMHGVVLTDQSGNPVTEVITWRDSLASIENGMERSAVASIRERCEEESLRAFGNELREGLPLATLFARRSRGLDVAGKVAHSLISYCAASLTDFSTAPMMHATDAAAHGFYRVVDGCWDHKTLEALELNGMTLPSVVHEVIPCGLSKEYDCNVHVALGDQQTSLYGMKLDLDELSLNIATGSQASRLVTNPKQALQLRPYFDDKYLSTVTHIPAGRAVNALIGLVTELSTFEADEAWQLIAQKTHDEPFGRMNIDLSFFPCVTGSTGHISNIQEGDLTIGQLFRSAVCNMADNYRRYSSDLFPDGDFRSVVLSGGLATRFTPLLDELKREFQGCEFRISSTEDASLEGLGLQSIRVLEDS